MHGVACCGAASGNVGLAAPAASVHWPRRVPAPAWVRRGTGMGAGPGCAGEGGIHQWSCKEVEAEPLSTPAFPLTLQADSINSGVSGPPRCWEPQGELRSCWGSPKPSLGAGGEALPTCLAPNREHRRVRPRSRPGSCLPWVQGPAARAEETRITSRSQNQGRRASKSH